jgi:hypothetical protein
MEAARTQRGRAVRVLCGAIAAPVCPAGPRRHRPQAEEERTQPHGREALRPRNEARPQGGRLRAGRRDVAGAAEPMPPRGNGGTHRIARGNAWPPRGAFEEGTRGRAALCGRQVGIIGIQIPYCIRSQKPGSWDVILKVLNRLFCS